MNRYFGEIGFFITKETAPGVWERSIMKRDYYGDIIRASRRSYDTNKVNPDLTISNQISIIADPYLMNNFMYIAYATVKGAKWKVSDVSIEYPRLVLSLGDLYVEN